MTWALGLKGGTNLEVTATGLRRDSLDTCIPMLWECMDPHGCMLIHIKGASGGLMVQKHNGIEGLVT